MPQCSSDLVVKIAPLLPCRVALWQEGAEVAVRLVRPSALAGFFPGTAELDDIAAEVEAGYWRQSPNSGRHRTSWPAPERVPALRRAQGGV